MSEADLRAMAEAGVEEGSIEREETEAVHSIFEFGDTIVREVMVPGRTSSRSRPTRRSATSRHWSSSTGTAMPVYREDLDDVAG